MWPTVRDGLSVWGVSLTASITPRSWAPLGDELAISNASFPLGVNHTVERVAREYGVKVGLHMHPDIVWPVKPLSRSSPGTRPNISESHSEISTRVPFCIA